METTVVDTDLAPSSDRTDSGSTGQKRWLLALLLLALRLRLWRLEQNGFGTDYYSAGVRSMMTGWHRFFYSALDPGGFVSVDKPPIALWIQVLSAKVLGFHGLAVLLPQVLEGVAAVWLLFHLVLRRFGSAVGQDPILTPEALAAMVESGQVRFIMVNDVWGLRRRPDVLRAGSAVADWVRANGTVVEPAPWRAEAASGSPRGGGQARPGGMQLYDMRPGAGLAP